MDKISVITMVLASKIRTNPSYRNILQAIFINSKAFRLLDLTEENVGEIRKGLVDELENMLIRRGRLSPKGQHIRYDELDIDFELEIEDILTISILSDQNVTKREFNHIDDFKKLGSPIIDSLDQGEPISVIAWEIVFENMYGSQIIMMDDALLEVGKSTFDSIRSHDVHKICAYFKESSL